MIPLFPWSLFYFRAYSKAVAMGFILSTKLISLALFSHLETLEKQQRQVSVWEKKSSPSVPVGRESQVGSNPILYQKLFLCSFVSLHFDGQVWILNM